MTTPDPRADETPGARSGVPDAPVTGTGPATPSAPPPADRPGSPPGSPPSSRPSSRHSAGRSIGLGLAAALLVFVTVVLVLFVLFNTQTVDISLVFGNVQAPLVLALVIAAVLGGLVVLLAGAALRARRRSR